MTLGREQEIRNFLCQRVFNPILCDPNAPENVLQAIDRISQNLPNMSAGDMKQYFFSLNTSSGQNIRDCLVQNGISYADVETDFLMSFGG